MRDTSNDLRLIVGENIRHCRENDFPGKGGMSKCAGQFGVSIQQWSPWELGKRLPKDERLEKIAEFFGKTVAWLRTRHVFDASGADQAQRFDIPVEGDDVRWFFRRFEDALVKCDRGDIVVSITIKPPKRRQKKAGERLNKPHLDKTRA